MNLNGTTTPWNFRHKEAYTANLCNHICEQPSEDELAVRNRTTTFRILCDTESTDVNKTRLTVSPGSTEPNHLKLELMTAAACPTYKPAMSPGAFAAGAASDGGLSMGSVLCILFFVFLGVYFVGGAIALRLLRGATGREMVPNVEFWSALPELIKDGVTFTFNGCRVRPASLYDSI